MSYSDKHRLSDDLRKSAPDLFRIDGFTIEREDSYPQPFGNAELTVRIKKIWLTFVWDRGEPFVLIQYEGRHGGSKALDDEVIRLTGHDTRAVPLTWELWSELIIANNDMLQHAYP